MKKDVRMELRLSCQEREKLQRMASESGMTASEMIREFVNKGVVVPRPPAEFREFTMALRRLGNNLNQVVALAHAKGILDVLRLNKLIDQLWDLEQYIRDYFRRAV